MKGAAILGLATGLGAIITMFAAVWALTKMGAGIFEIAGLPSPEGSEPTTMDLGTFPWMIGGFVALATFLKELVD